MTRPLFIHQHDSQHSGNLELTSSSSAGIFSSAQHQSFPNQEDDGFHLKRIGTSFPNDKMLTEQPDHTQTHLYGHNPSHQNTHLIGNSKAETKERTIYKEQRTRVNTDRHIGIVNPLASTENQNLADDDILEYDEDNVIVIDLDDIRNNPAREREISIPSTNMDAPKRKVEIKRQVYYDDSDLFSPPPPPLDDDTDIQEGNMSADPSSSNDGALAMKEDSSRVLPAACDPSIVRTLERKDSSSSSSTASVNSQNDEPRYENINQVPLPPPIQSVLDHEGTNQEHYFDMIDDTENGFNQKDIVQPPSPFSERSCSSSATTGASSIKQPYCQDNLSKNDEEASAELTEIFEQSITNPTPILKENEQHIFYESSKFDRRHLCGKDNHSQLTLSSISSDTVCQQDPVGPVSIATVETNYKLPLNQSIIEHPTRLPPVKVQGRLSLSSATCSSNNRNLGHEESVSNSTKMSMHKKSLPYPQEDETTSSLSVFENEQCNECHIYKDNNFTENQKDKRDRPNKLFPSVPTSSSVIINSNSGGGSPLASAKCSITPAQLDESSSRKTGRITGKTF